ncbi:OsmC family peroxiredoxin [Lichenibacterium minor]|uniref:OsmC family peroxiredoxin n=1 Tax=Lichenibacterium minor TaxID=2316528 RepID=A0A4Q2TY98_9HYPH|nr:OsmC family protein [Lichenibacterium minor]RYC29082.1 OsmC family peroxiredoxin [Lichenibacterium minor]
MTDLTDDVFHLDEARPGEPTSAHARTLRCRTIATTQLRQRHHIRDLAPMGSGAAQAGDETLLSEEQEPHPSEMLLAALGACLTVGIQANAVARGIPLRRLEVHSHGDVDPAALWGTGSRRARPLGFQSIAIEVHIDADVPREVLKALVDYAVLWSPVANTLHDPVDLVVSLVDRQDGS